MTQENNHSWPGATRLLLRDAVAILPDNRRNLTERLQRSVDLAEKFNLDLEITLDVRFFVDQDTALLAAIKKATASFATVVYHLHSSRQYLFGDNTHTQQLVKYCADQIGDGHLRGLCVHPDLVADFAVFKPLVSPDFYVAGEVLDEECDSYNTFDSIADLLACHEYLGLVLDTAHIAGMQPAGEPALEKYCAAFADRVVEVHISQTGNYYDCGKMGDTFTTNHSLLSLGGNDIKASLGPLLAIPDLMIVIEGVIPAGNYGNTLLKHEVDCLTEILQARS